VRQRIIVRYRLDPFNEEETSSYIAHRLKVAGTEKQIFSLNAVKEIFTLSAGYPRLINILCDNALLYGWSAGLQLIDADVIMGRAEELRIEKPKREEKDARVIQKIEEEISDQSIEGEKIENDESLFVIDQKLNKHEIEETKDYEFQIEEEISDQSIEGEKIKNDESLFVTDQKLNEHEIEKTKALILRDIPQEKPSRKPFESLKYITIVVFVFFTGLAIFYFFNANIKSDLRWSMNELAPKQKFVISENKKPSVDKEQIIVSKPSKKNSTEQNNLTQFEEEKSTRKKSGLIDKSTADLNEKIAEKNFSPKVDIRESYSEEPNLKEALNPPSSVKSYDTDNTRASLPNSRFLEKSRIIINFTHNSFELDENARDILDLIIKFALEHLNAEMTVEGFTDSFGNYWYNQKLSQLRADAVKAYFVEQGISPLRIKAIGKGQDSPIGKNETIQGRMRNRRVAIKFNLVDN
jgi:outer membrane protein OmpA-like peptidoglycan-associated protein